MRKIQLLGLLFTAMTAYAQSTTENYIQSKTCLSGDCSKKTETITYFDGLGRPKQIISVKSTPTGKDLVTPITYDAFGRQAKDILPVPANTLNSAIHTGIVNESTANSYYGASNAYTEKEIENSPLDRVLQVAQPGDPWKMSSGHTQKYKYETNLGTEVRKFNTHTTTGTVGTDNKTISSVSIVSGSEFYAAGTLYKNTVTDEDGTPVTEFKNGRGETVLVRRTDGTQNIDTYYAYNEYGQKVFVIPPLAVKKIEQNNNVVTTDIVNSLCYQYRYDGLDRQVEKRLPGRDDWESVVYDAADRPVLTQDVNLKNKGQWLLTKYDAFGRIAYTGLVSGGDRASMQSQLATQVVSETPSDTGFSKNGIMVYYTNNFLSGFTTVLAVNYYDAYPRDTKEFPPAKILEQYVINEDKALNGGISTKGLPTASYVKNIEDDNWTKTYFYYNTKGGKVAEKSWNHLGGYTKKEFKLDFTGAVDESYTYHKKGSSDSEVVIKERFVYDDQKRLLKHYHQVNSQGEELLAENTYNDLGQLINKKTGNTTGTPLQSIDQTYNIRGWITKVNDPANLNGKLFAYEIKYHNPVYSTVSTGKYNGNISEIDWQAADGRPFSRYNYQYDGLDRLKSGIYSEPNTTVPQNNYYNEVLTYDVNGNIQTLKRNMLIQNLGTQVMDDLSYTYTGNRLTSVNEASGNYNGYPDSSNNPISYDANGNMINHLDRGILQINYNYLNLPDYVKFDQTYTPRNLDPGVLDYNVNTKYLYNAAGGKLRKVYTYGSGRGQMETIDKTDYLDGFQYTNDVLSFVPTSEGYFDFVQNKYLYNYTDHLGNIRLAFYKDVSGNLKIDRTTHYYPFGLEFGDYLDTTNSISPNYVYSYNGKEKQRETGWDDYGARMYMPDIGRWGAVDPLAEKSRRFTPYNYALDNPILYIDPDGQEAQQCCGALWNITKAYYSGLYQGAKGVVQGTANFVRHPITSINAQSKAMAKDPVGAMNSQLLSVAKTVIPVTNIYSLGHTAVTKGANAAGKEAGGDLTQKVIEGTVAAGLKGTGSLLSRTKSTPNIFEQITSEAKRVHPTVNTSTLEPGPYAGSSIPARSKSQVFNAAEKEAINQIGSTEGCHTCGVTESGRASGNFTPDHQPISGLVPEGTPQSLLPHCASCSASQGGTTSALKRKGYDINNIKQ